MMSYNPKHCTFEQAKSLKEKGFDNVECTGYYHINNGYTKGYAFCYSVVDIQSDNGLLAPEQHVVVEWLLINHGIWVSVHLELCRGYEGYDFNFEYLYYKEKTVSEQEKQYETLGETVFNSPQEAYSAAFDYILENLI